MSASPQTPKDRDVRDYLAVEQTFLAWIRTGLAFMGFGFVVARFGLFLQQLALVEPALKIGHHGISIWFGTVMMLMGVGMNAFSAWHHVRNSIRAIQGSPSRQQRPSSRQLFWLSSDWRWPST
jgi:putative membrane protein